MSDLVKRLRIKAGMIEMGERIEWGSDSALMREAADALEATVRGAREDYKLVPVEPTLDMLSAGLEVYGREDCAEADVLGIFKAMLADAPAVQGEPQPTEQRPDPDVRMLAASLYQACGAYDMPTRVLDALSAASNGEPFAHMIDGLLPCVPPSDQNVQGDPVGAEHQPRPEGIREGAPYDDPAFSALCREHEIWGTPAAAQCAVFWEAGKRVAEQKPDPDYIEYEILRRAMSSMGLAARDALAARRKQGGEK